MPTILRNIVTSVIVFTLILIILAVKDRRSKGTIIHRLGLLIFMGWMCIVFYLTGVTPLSGFHLDIRLNEISVIPIYGIGKMIYEAMCWGVKDNAIGDSLLYIAANILGNMILFGPIGFFCPLLFQEYRNFKKTAKIGFGISLLIEISQLFLSRGTDVDDLILNTTGCILGYLCFYFLRKIIPRLTDRFMVSPELKPNRKRKIELLCCVGIPYFVFVLLGFVDRFYFFRA